MLQLPGTASVKQAILTSTHIYRNGWFSASCVPGEGERESLGISPFPTTEVEDLDSQSRFKLVSKIT